LIFCPAEPALHSITVYSAALKPRIARASLAWRMGATIPEPMLPESRQ